MTEFSASFYPHSSDEAFSVLCFTTNYTVEEAHERSGQELVRKTDHLSAIMYSMLEDSDLYSSVQYLYLNTYVQRWAKGIHRARIFIFASIRVLMVFN